MKEKILLLADANSTHIEKWATALSYNGYTVGLFSFNKCIDQWYTKHKNISLIYEPEIAKDSSSLTNKLSYVTILPKLLKAIKQFEPDILHAHYASSYGLLGALSGFKPFVLSAWGSDIFEFPKKSFLHKQLLKFNLKRANMILSTSYAMKNELTLYTKKEIQVTPFGVDMNVFYPKNVKTKEEEQFIYIGIVKAIEDEYGLQTIIEATSIIKVHSPNLKFKLLLVGGGKRVDFYKKMVKNFSLEDCVIFTGKIPHSKITYYHNIIDIFLNVSIVNESFGVSVIEAMACQKPVIVTDALGLEEIVDEGNGIVIRKEDAIALSKAILNLIAHPQYASHLARNGRMHVQKKYSFDKSLEIMVNLYGIVLKQNIIQVPNFCSL
ncbi:MAG: glycosyltransferase [Bacteroidia bacterium]